MLLKMSVPVYKRGRWNRLELDGKIELSSEGDTLSEAYESLKQEVDAFLTRLESETRLAETAEALQLEIDGHTSKLVALAKDIERASEHYKNLRVFLENLGIDPNKKQLTFDKHLLLSNGPVSDVAAMSDPLDHEF
jgi:hypothetical protein